MSLKKYIDEVNGSWFRKGPTIDIKSLTDAQAQEMFQQLDNNLSPENISCDGEAPRAQVIRRTKLYRGAIDDLKAKGFVPKETMYCY
jgi:hypothetical protein